MAHKYGVELSAEQEAYLKNTGFPSLDEIMSGKRTLPKMGPSTLETIEAGPNILRKASSYRETYYYAGPYKVGSLEQCVRVLQDMGWSGDEKDLIWEPSLDLGSGGNYAHHIRITFKEKKTHGEAETPQG